MDHEEDGRSTWWEDWRRWGDQLGWRLNGALDYAGCYGCGGLALLALVLFCSGMTTGYILCLYVR